MHYKPFGFSQRKKNISILKLHPFGKCLKKSQVTYTEKAPTKETDGLE